MSHSNLISRMTTSLAITLATAAITACGGGASDGQTLTDSATASGVSSVVDAASAAAATDLAVTTNGAAVIASSDSDTSTTASVDTTVASVDPALTTVASTSVGGNAADTQVEALAAGASPLSSVSIVPAATRPAGNTGTGFYVVGNKLYDAKGKEFRIRGVNRTHWDSYGSPAGLPMSGANTERIALNFTRPVAGNFDIVRSQMIANKIVPMPGNWGTTCKSDPASLTAVVDTWVAQASTWTTLNSNGLINIANEWGPANSTVWRDNYITAVARMRAAGYTGTLVVDSGGCGQDAQDVVKYGPAVLASDPQKNILFDVHVYGSFHYPATASWMQDYTKAMAQLKASGLAIILGEFGPGRNVGPSPTMVTPEQVIASAEDAGFGWMPWAWDDNNLANCAANDNWFSMTTKCGGYKTNDDLTLFGKTIVPILQRTAVKATIF